MKYVNVIIDNKSNATDVTFTYGCADDEVKVGSKVYVPFARSKRLREGYVLSVEGSIDEEILPKLKYVEKVDEDVCLTEEMVRTAIWMRGKYLCRYIDAIRCFVPAGSRAKRKERPDPYAGEKGEASTVEELTAEQKAALEQIEKPLAEKVHDRFLIHGVTGSGKTELYIRAAGKALEDGRGAIILVPEISMTPQIIDRFIGVFGQDSVAVLHSRLTAGERFDQWKKIQEGKVRIVIGARLAVFAPVKDLGLIVVDEEHETTYKSDFTPKYDTIEVAIKRLQDRDNQGVLILGSATPSVVTYSRACEGIYKLIKLTKRYNEVRMPEVQITDMRQELKDGNRSILSRRLMDEMQSQLAAGRQVMLFLNRRGYSTFVSCRECGYVAKCPSCGLSMTYHRNTGRLMCHYCGRTEPAPTTCPECGSKYIRYFGSGTEKLEETVRELFPDHPMERLDLDSVKEKGALKKKLAAFGRGDTHILIGTQLIAKGLDFRNVGLVGIISADVSLNIPDFRSPERTFQLITQSAGRAGRGDEVGRVVIQTYNPEHYAVALAAEQNYEAFYAEEMKFRSYMGYPPYCDIFQIVFMADQEQDAQAGAEFWHSRLKQVTEPQDAANMLPPQEAYMNKIHGTYRYTMVIKCPKGLRTKYSAYIRRVRDIEREQKTPIKYAAVVDINPYSFA